MEPNCCFRMETMNVIFWIPDSDAWPNCGQRIVECLWQLWTCGRATMLRALLILFLYDFENIYKKKRRVFHNEGRILGF